MLTAERVREVLRYNPETGQCIYVCGNHAGLAAGTFDRSVGYLRVRIDGANYLLHRVIWLYVTGEWPAHSIDHIDLNGVNNKWVNLREANKAENARNAGVPKHNTSGLKGVSWCRATRKYRADICVDGRGINLGRYDSPDDAHVAYVIAAEKYFGCFARAA